MAEMQQQQQQQYPTGVNPELIENGEFKDDGMIVDHDLKDAEAEDQIQYIRKVLGIVSVQMTLTFILAGASSMNKTVGSFFKNSWTLVLGSILMLVCACMIILDKERRRRVPDGYLWLAGMTLGEASFLAAVCADLTEFSVFCAIMATCCSVVALFGAALFAASSIDREKLLKNMIFGLFGAMILQLIMLFCILIISPFDNQALIFGLSPIMLLISGFYVMWALLFVIVPDLEDKDDYIMGAMRLYMEIARLFFWLLKTFGKKK